ncbi:MAG TPA: 3,4-dihydroxy-2-butanone-4-phosphate synthase [Candidatus Nitrosocosmicus sp.]|nr:3,4-dihydroxy-2-butanone-4-phosphate synthase [Candidatus Nitrosocosmicus sp.]
MSKISEAVTALKNGNFVLIHDDTSRENEIDMVVSAESILPKHILTMRKDAGGLICTAISSELSLKLGLPYIYDVLKNFGKSSKSISMLNKNTSPYGDNPSFSITLNHKNTYTGITDYDRALTISSLAKICKGLGQNIENDGMMVEEFQNSFVTPGHVPILIASKGLIDERMGHTEMSVFLAKTANIANVTTICEMLDPNNYKALSYKDACKYAQDNNIVILESKDLLAYANNLL